LNRKENVVTPLIPTKMIDVVGFGEVPAAVGIVAEQPQPKDPRRLDLANEELGITR
jgi:hypothetical protein